mmetsp:Transcript_15503/g.33544  ORF Transcript_15503/g.33544 Transcript_15503/m.33544 type:complete len:371 (-) Transcript_15503:1-1113(-)
MPPACYGAIMLFGIGFKLGAMINIDAILDFELTTSVEIGFGFNYSAHTKAGFVYDYDSGPSFGEEGTKLETKFMQLPFEFGKIEGQGHLDIALKPTLAAGIVVGAGIAGAHALVENSVEVFVRGELDVLFRPANGVPPSDRLMPKLEAKDLDEYPRKYGDCTKNHSIEARMTYGRRKSGTGFGFKAALWQSIESDDTEQNKGSVWSQEFGPYENVTIIPNSGPHNFLIGCWCPFWLDCTAPAPPPAQTPLPAGPNSPGSSASIVSNDGDGRYNARVAVIIGGHTTTTLTFQRQLMLTNAVAATLDLPSSRVVMIGVSALPGANTTGRRLTQTASGSMVRAEMEIVGFDSQVEARAAVDTLDRCVTDPGQV